MCEKMAAYEAKLDKRKHNDKRIDVLNKYFDEVLIPMSNRTQELLEKNKHIPTLVNTQNETN